MPSTAEKIEKTDQEKIVKEGRGAELGYPDGWDPDYLQINHLEGCPIEPMVQAKDFSETDGELRMESYAALAPRRSLNDGTEQPSRWIKVVRCQQCGGDFHLK